MLTDIIIAWAIKFNCIAFGKSAWINDEMDRRKQLIPQSLSSPSSSEPTAILLIRIQTIMSFGRATVVLMMTSTNTESDFEVTESFVGDGLMAQWGGLVKERTRVGHYPMKWIENQRVLKLIEKCLEIILQQNNKERRWDNESTFPFLAEGVPW